jgi:hypothetical protein
MSATAQPRCGLVGPARTRNGLGPFLAVFLEQAGAEVVAVAGREPRRAAHAAAALGQRLGHAVQVADSPQALAARGDLHALVIAAPIEAHLPCLRAALDAGLHVLCEKPLVAPSEHAGVPPLLDEFAAARRILLENCLWPMALPALPRLYPDLDRQHVRAVEMMLSPAASGLAMLVDSLSHFLSLIQALVPVDHHTRIAALDFSDPPSTARRLTLQLALEAPFPRVTGTLLLEPGHPSPRPAWFSVDGARVERRIGMPDYAIRFAGAGAEVSIGDPLAAVVYGFVHMLRENDLERARAESLAIRHRARLYQQILEAWAG